MHKLPSWAISFLNLLLTPHHSKCCFKAMVFIHCWKELLYLSQQPFVVLWSGCFLGYFLTLRGPVALSQERSGSSMVIGQSSCWDVTFSYSKASKRYPLWSSLTSLVIILFHVFFAFMILKNSKDLFWIPFLGLRSSRPIYRCPFCSDTCLLPGLLRCLWEH